MSRVCCRCKVEKALEEFPNNRSEVLGKHYECRPCFNEDCRASYQKRRVDKQAVARAYRLNHPDKYLAHSLLKRAVKRGTLTRQPCQVCGDPKTDGHHEDYTKPLEVQWLCRKHHAARHKELDATA
jgi:hypothetical protein